MRWEDSRNTNPTFFEALTAELQEELESFSMLVQIQKGDTLFMPGDDSDYAYLIKSGIIKATFLGLDGSEITLPLLRPGQILGISSFLDWDQRICYATAISDVAALRIPRKGMKIFIQNHIEVAVLIIEYLGMRLRNAWKIVEELSSKNVRERLIRLLFTLSNDFGRKSESRIVIDINLTHEQIAQMIGTSRQTASTIINALEKANAIKKSRNRIIICERSIFNELE